MVYRKRAYKMQHGYYLIQMISENIQVSIYNQMTGQFKEAWHQFCWNGLSRNAHFLSLGIAPRFARKHRFIGLCSSSTTVPNNKDNSYFLPLMIEGDSLEKSSVKGAQRNSVNLPSEN